MPIICRIEMFLRKLLFNYKKPKVVPAPKTNRIMLYKSES